MRKIEKTVVRYEKTPISSKTSWDSSKAVQSLKNWATNEDGETDWNKFGRGFTWKEPNADTQASFKLPHHEIIDGVLKLNRQGVIAAYAATQGARGGVDIPSDEMGGVINHLLRHYDDLGIERPTEKSFDIMKASELTDYNKYVWISGERKPFSGSFVITESDIEISVVDKDQGIAFYHKSDEEKKPLVWRFSRSKGWTEDAAKTYVLVNGKAVTKDEVRDAIKSINECDGVNYLDYKLRKFIYKALNKNTFAGLPKLKSQAKYKNMKNIKEKMKKLAELSNIKFHEFIESAQAERLNIIKSTDDIKQIEKKGFKIHGTLEAFKIIKKNKDGKDEERWRLRTRFVSNKADLHVDITSKEAITKGIERLQNGDKVIPIRFEHESDDYGVWDTFKTYEENGVFYGEAEGELDKTLNRAQDLWKEIYEYGKEFATSYGGRWIEFSWIRDEDTDEILRVFEDVLFEEISLTTRPANPDTALEALNKYAIKLEKTIDNNNLDKFINNQKMNKEKDLKKETEIKKSVKPEKVNKKETETKKSVKPTENKDISKALDAIENLSTVVLDLKTSLEEVTKRLKNIEDSPQAPKKTIKNDKQDDIEDLEKSFKEKYPMSYLVAKAAGRFDAETEE